MAPAGLIFIVLAAVGCSTVSGSLLYYANVSTLGSYNVSYNNRSFIVNGQPTFFLSGSVHYPRSRPAMWDAIFQAMLEDGLNMVETYVFWNVHEPVRGQGFNMEGSANLTLFLEKAARAGLFVNLRIGPYVCAEWNWGGLPLWLRDIKGMAVRSSNPPWQDAMTKYVLAITKLVSPFLAKNGGPIVLAQIENEYSWNDPAYVEWCGALVSGLHLEIPWLMCNGRSANRTVNACNGNDCAEYANKHAKLFPTQPLVWTEDEGWFEEWDRAPNSTAYDNRTPQEMAFVVLKWFGRGGAHHNYYMWYGGNHYAQWAANGVANKYADGANLHFDMLPNEPKKTHLRTLHRVLTEYSKKLLDHPAQANKKLHVQVWDQKSQQYIDSKYQWIYLYMGAVIFLENEDNKTASVMLGSWAYEIKARSVKVIDYQSMDVVYDSTNVNYAHLKTHRVYDPLVPKFEWKVWEEKVVGLDGAFAAGSPLEQLNLTSTNTDYLFYQTRVKVSKPGSMNVTIHSTDANAFIAFVDGKMQSSAFNTVHKYNPFNVTYSLPVTLDNTKEHNLTLLSVNLGVDNGVPPGSFDYKGIVHGVSLGEKDIWDGMWWHRPKLEGERLKIYTDDGSANVNWKQDINMVVNRPVVWFQAEFTRISVESGHSMMLDLAGMGRGHLFLNGFPLGRYWSIKVGGVYVQRYYFIPPDLIKDTNLLTLVEELGATNPGTVSIVDSSFTKL